MLDPDPYPDPDSINSDLQHWQMVMFDVQKSAKPVWKVFKTNS